MLLNGILLHFKKITIKFIYILTMIFFLSCIFLSVMNVEVQAAQYTEKYTTSEKFNSNLYPGYTTLIESLKEAHPN